MKKMRTAATLFTIFFMAAALYLCARYEKTPDSIFTGKVNTPAGEWSMDTSSDVPKATVTFSLADRGEHEEWMLYLQSHWRDCSIRVGDEIIYHKDGKRDGAVHLFDIPSGDSLTIDFNNATQESLSGIEASSIMLGNKNNLYRMILK